jgi:hypothetical protein
VGIEVRAFDAATWDDAVSLFWLHFSTANGDLAR